MKKNKIISYRNIIIVFLLFFIISLLVYKNLYPSNNTNKKESSTNKVDNNNNKFHNINIYVYYESDIENEDIKDFYETKIDYFSTIKVNDGKNLEYVFKKHNIKYDRIHKPYYYDETTLDKLKKENDETKKAISCYKKYKSLEKCNVSYYFTDHLDIADYFYPIKSDLNIIIVKTALDDFDAKGKLYVID